MAEQTHKRVKLTRSIILNQEHAGAGSVHEVPRALAQRLIGRRLRRTIVERRRRRKQTDRREPNGRPDDRGSANEAGRPAPPKFEGPKK